MATLTEPQTDKADVLKAYAAYPFHTDETYQQGVASILAGSHIETSSPEQRAEIERRTRVFYFNKITGHSITTEEAQQCEQSSQQQQGSETTDNTNDETRVLTFAELKELIETGNVDKIPNNKIIPEGVNDAPPSESKAPLPKKPWETAATS